MEITPPVNTAMLRGMKSFPMHCTSSEVGCRHSPWSQCCSPTAEQARQGSPVEHHCWIMLAVSLAISCPVVFCPVACNRCEPSTCCSLLCQGMWFVDPFNRFLVLMTLLGRVPRWPCSSKEYRDHRSALLFPCMDALQAEMGSWVALRLPGEMT